MDETEPRRQGELSGTTEIARNFFDGLWAGKDPWRLETSELDQRRYDRQLALLQDHRYGRALELGCGAGAFTGRLSRVCDHLLAVDLSERAITRAAESHAERAHVEFRTADIVTLDVGRDGPWDLVVLTETAYYLGWLYPLFDVAWLARRLLLATNSGGRLLLANTVGSDDGIMSSWSIHTYRDLFVNVGYEVEAEEILHGTKDTVDFEILLSLFRRG